MLDVLHPGPERQLLLFVQMSEKKEVFSLPPLVNARRAFLCCPAQCPAIGCTPLGASSSSSRPCVDSPVSVLCQALLWARPPRAPGAITTAVRASFVTPDC
eukprot:1159472-Pelagomonas_calceolata.AAC.17